MNRRTGPLAMLLVALCGLLLMIGTSRAQPTTAPTTQMAADPTTPKGTLTLLARATASGDSASVRSLLHVTTPQEEKLADILMDRNDVNVKFKAAATKAFGEEVANQIAPNAVDEEQRIERAEVKIDEDKATVKLDEESDPVSLVKVDGKWKLTLAALTAGIPAAEIDVRLDQMNMLSSVVKEATTELNEGKYKTPDELGDAIRGKLTERVLKQQAEAAATQPATQPQGPAVPAPQP